MSEFWSGFVVVLIVVNLSITTLLKFATGG